MFPSGSSISRSNASQLRIEHVDVSHTGWYQCAVTINEGIVLSQRSWLEVVVDTTKTVTKLALKQFARNYVNSEHSQTVHLVCSADLQIDQYVIIWMRESVAIDLDDHRFTR